MKKGWEMRKLGDVCDIKHGYAFDGSDFDTDFFGDTAIVLTPGNFSENSSLIFNERNTKRIKANYSKDFEFNIGDLVVVMTDLSSKMKILGKPAIIESKNILHNQRIGRFIFFDNLINKNFLFYLLQTDSYLKSIKDSATGTMVRHTAPKRILDFKIPILSIKEQQRIVSILDEAFAAIDQAKENMQRNLQNAKELFQSKLNSVFKAGGDGWEKKTLGEVCKYEKTPNKRKDLPYVGLENIESNTGKFIGSHEAQQVKSSTFYFNDKHVLYGRLRPYLNKVLMPDFEGHCSTEIFPIKVGNELERGFLFYWLIASNTVEKIDATWTGARMPRANMNAVIEFKFSFPKSLKAQKAIVDRFDTLSEETKKLESLYQQKLNSLEDLKKGILQKAFSGELTEKAVAVLNTIERKFR